MNDFNAFIVGVLAVLIICLCFLNIEKIECKRSAETLGYGYKYDIFCGCILKKPDGKNILLKNYRDFGD